MVKVIEAHNLENKDYNGLSDAFCVVQLNNDIFRTQTICNNLSPSWQKVFQFTNVQTICDVLNVTVYDEDYEHKYEFLGRLSMPLWKVQNNQKQWYVLKDKRLRAPAQQKQPKILLEIFFTWNTFLGCQNIIKNPKMELYCQKLPKELNTPVQSINRIKAATLGLDDMLLKVLKKVKHFE